MFEKIKYYYKSGFYKLFHMDKLLAVGVISPQEYDNIVKEG